MLARLTVQTDADARARILPVLMSQHERLAAAGITVPQLDAFLVPPATPAPTIPLLPTVLPDGTLPTLVPIPEDTPVPTLSIPLPTVPVPTLPNLFP